MPEPPETSADWLKPPEEQEGLKRYVETFRERFRLIVVTMAIATGVAILYVLTAAKTYEAEAELLVTPVNSSDPVLASLGLVGVSADPTRDVETASRLVTNLNVAKAVKKDLHSSLSPSALLGKVTAVPVAQSNIVSVTATGASPAEAKRVADAFADETVETRTKSLHEQIERQLPVLRSKLGSEGATPAGEESLAGQVAQLQLLATGPTPDMRVETEAALPTAQASPRTKLSVAAGIVAGAILGIVAAFTAQVLDPRLRREAQLRRLYSLPILGRIPNEPHADGEPLVPQKLSASTSEAYRTLRTTLTAGRSGGQVILVTGSGSSEGKSTTAVNLAASLALGGRRAILIESDLRKPTLGRALGTAPEQGGVVGVLLEKCSLAEALTQVDPYGSNLQLLLADYEGGWIAELFTLASAREMIEEARRMADYVIVDSPPLNDVVDALPLAQLADAVLIVAKLGRTRLDKLAQLGELLAENGIRPAGFAVVGTPRPRDEEYRYHRGGSAGSNSSGRSLLSRLRT